MTNDTISNHYSEIGNVLRQAREERRLSLVDAAGKLHIRSRYLQALEDGNIAALPGLAYAKGYLVRYITLLGLDQTEMMRRFELSLQESRTPFFYIPTTFSQEKHATPQIVWVGLGLAVIVFVLWAWLGRAEYGQGQLIGPVPEKTPEETVKDSKQNPCLGTLGAVYPPCYWQPKEEPKLPLVSPETMTKQPAKP